MKIRVLTPDPGNAYFDDLWREQGADMAAALALAGLVPDLVPWTASLEPVDADLVLPLLAWGYHDEPARWAAMLDRAEAVGLPLANPPALLRWNADKRYLVELADGGAPIAPMLAFDAITPADLVAARARFGDGELVAKPVVSAGAQGIVRLAPGAALPAEALGTAMLVQPFLPAIVEEGEYSLFHFGGQFSHAILKTPASGDFRVQYQFGGRFRAVDPPPAAAAAARAILALLPVVPLYARIDLVRIAPDRFGLMELELIEPDLFFEAAADRGLAFALAVRAAAEAAIGAQPSR